VSSGIKKKAKDIKLLIMDVDGVLTTGCIVIDGLGRETKIFDVQDGFGIMLWKRAGLKTAIITAGLTAAVKKRAAVLKVDYLYQKARNKLPVYEELKNKLRVNDNQICFIGDDIIDVPLLKRVGLACSVPNAHDEIKPYAHYITKREGGKGAVREIIDMMLRAKGLWKEVTGDYIK